MQKTNKTIRRVTLLAAFTLLSALSYAQPARLFWVNAPPVRIDQARNNDVAIDTVNNHSYLMVKLVWILNDSLFPSGIQGPAGPAGPTYTGASGINVSGTVITNTGDRDSTDDVLKTTAHSGDISGAYNNLQINNGVVTSIELANGSVNAAKLANMGALSGQIMKWNGSAWAAANDSIGSAGTTYTGGAGIGVSGTVITNNGDRDSSNDVLKTSGFAGDITGTYNTTLIGTGAVTSGKILNGTIALVDLSSMGATSGKILKYNGSAWAIANDSVGTSGATYTGGAGIGVSGTVITNNGDRDSSNDVLTSTNHAGDVTGLYNNLQLGVGVVGTPEIAALAITLPKLANMGAASGQILKYNGSAWTVASDSVGPAPITYTSGAGINIASTVITNTGDRDSTNDVLKNTAHAGDVTGVYNALVIANGAVTAPKIASMGATAGQVLKYTGSAWAPGTDSLGTGGANYTAGAGINIVGSLITNTGDVNASDDVITSTNHAGDITGAYNNLQIAAGVVSTPELANAGVTAAKLATMGATSGQVLKYNGSAWAPANDSVGAGGGVTYTAGSGINITGTTINNAGDLNAGDDLNVGTAFGGDVTGTYFNLQLNANSVGSTEITNNSITAADLSSMGAATNQVMKWNGTSWNPGNDNTASAGTAIPDAYSPETYGAVHAATTFAAAGFNQAYINANYPGIGAVTTDYIDWAAIMMCLQQDTVNQVCHLGNYTYWTNKSIVFRKYSLTQQMTGTLGSLIKTNYVTAASGITKPYPINQADAELMVSSRYEFRSFNMEDPTGLKNKIAIDWPCAYGAKAENIWFFGGYLYCFYGRFNMQTCWERCFANGGNVNGFIYDMGNWASTSPATSPCNKSGFRECQVKAKGLCRIGFGFYATDNGFAEGLIVEGDSIDVGIDWNDYNGTTFWSFINTNFHYEMTLKTTYAAIRYQMKQGTAINQQIAGQYPALMIDATSSSGNAVITVSYCTQWIGNASGKYFKNTQCNWELHNNPGFRSPGTNIPNLFTGTVPSNCAGPAGNCFREFVVPPGSNAY